MQIVGIKAQSALAGVQQNLREGDVVFAKVLKNLGGGRYLLSFAGGRFFAKSEAPLAVGQGFRAQIFLQGNAAALKIVQGQAPGAAPRNPVQAFSVASPEAQEFLSALGLEADGLGAKILQLWMQSGAKIDSGKMQKIRRLAQRFAGRENAAAEAAFVLEEKGLESDSAALEKLLDLLDGGSDADGGSFGGKDASENGGGESGRPDDNSAQGQNAPESSAALDVDDELEPDAPPKTEVGPSSELDEIQKELCRYFSEIFSEGFLQKKEGGFLSLFNHSGRRRPDAPNKSWAVFPFEYQISAESGSGLLRLFLDYESKACEKLLINFKSSSENIFFTLYFDKKKPSRLVFSCDSEEGLKQGQGEMLEGLARSLGAELEAKPFEEFSEFGAEDSPIFGAEAFA